MVLHNVEITYLICCMIAAVSGDEFIVGGSNAVRGQFPYQVSLRTEENKHICGGTILQPRWVLTAAHCIIYQPLSMVKSVVVGSELLDSGGKGYLVDKGIIHESYNAIELENDIALLKIKEDIDFGPNVYSIAVSTTPVGDSDTMVVSGWGFTDTAGTIKPNNLQFLSVTSISNKECQTLTTLNIPSTTFCTKSPAGQGICNGDSGGPIVKNNQVQGIVSWRNGLCGSGRPCGYTRVYNYKFWIWWNQLKG